MRILFLNDLWDPRIGSSVRQMYSQSELLRADGHETVIVSTTPERALVGRATVEGCQVVRLHSDYPLRFRAWKSLRNRTLLGALRAFYAEWKPDVVHSHLIHTHLSYAALTEARAAGAGVVFTAHDSMTYCYQKLDCFHGGAAHDYELRDYRAQWQKCLPCQRFRYRPGRNAAIAAVLARDVDRFTVVSDELGNAVRANGIRVDRTIHNALRLQQDLPSAQAVAAFRAKFKLEGKRLIALGGRLHVLKGVVQLFQMLSVLRDEFPELRLLVLGKEDVYRREFEAAAQALDVDDLVVPTGWLDGAELAAAYAALDVMVSPSICLETFGLINLEAMEHSKPVVATTYGGCKEVVQDQVTGLVANPFHVREFAERIATLLRDHELRAKFGAAGRRRLEEHFTMHRLHREFLEEYELAREAAQRRQATAAAT
ncbi:MAG: glycosyltransferase family 4 protein [Planctomycetes bacterium]|nr:glycosyltransferase family 4 protein [Planctomycetota bacterium]